MKKVMVRAWEIAREAVKKFGGKVKEFFQQALIIAWGEIKGGVKMVELKGTEKQIAYANDLRSNAIEAINKVEELGTQDLSERFSKKFFNIKAELESCTSAVAIINSISKIDIKKCEFESEVNLLGHSVQQEIIRRFPKTLY